MGGDGEGGAAAGGRSWVTRGAWRGAVWSVGANGEQEREKQLLLLDWWCSDGVLEAPASTDQGRLMKLGGVRENRQGTKHMCETDPVAHQDTSDGVKETGVCENDRPSWQDRPTRNPQQHN